MAFWDIALLAADSDFNNRIAACATVEGLVTTTSPQWASDHAWELAAAPGFGEAYAFAIANGVPNPGRDPSVITDEQILSAVQSLPPA